MFSLPADNFFFLVWFVQSLEYYLPAESKPACAWFALFIDSFRVIISSLSFGIETITKFSGIMTYDGLENCIRNNQTYESQSRTSRGDGCATDSLDDDDLSCSSSKDAFGSFSSKWLTVKKDEQVLDEWELSESPHHFYVKEKPAYSIQFSEVEAMKEKFANLLLGEDITGGCKGLTSSLALSNAIANLAGIPMIETLIILCTTTF